MDPSSIHLRKYPYPFRAALSICNDIDGTSFRDFALIHDFLNGTGETPLGPGLGLSLADSFWFFSHENTPDHAFCYFDQAGRPSAYAPVIRELIQAGFIDTLHSYGNFSQLGGFSRDLAQKCLDEMARYDLDLAVWVNHGDEHNLQNIGPEPHHRGDKAAEEPGGAAPAGPRPDADHPYYHSDLLVAGGFRYFWDSENALTKIVGQNRACGWREALLDDLMSPSILDRSRRLASACRRGLMRMKRERAEISAPVRAAASRNALLIPDRLADGQSVIGFKRLGSGRYDWSDDLGFLIRDAVLNRLSAVGGASILYIHWGDRRDRTQPLPFTAAAVAACNHLAARSQSGEIWVPGTRVLLDYVWGWQNLNWRVSQEDNSWRIEITLNSPEEPKHLQRNGLPPGLTFYCPEPERTHLVCDGKPVSCKINPKDQTGMASLSIPLKNKTYPFNLCRLELAG